MNESFATPNSDENLLAQFMKELAERGEGVVAVWTARHPHLAKELGDLAPMGGMVGASRPDEEPRPTRLGDFQIIGKMARGGMGDIYEAVQEPLGRRVVVKTIRRGRISPWARERFLREQEVLARLHQTHIVPIHAAGEEEEGALQYFAMPYIEGAALHHVVQSVARESSQQSRKTPTLGEVASQLAADGGPQVSAMPAADPKRETQDESPPRTASEPTTAPPRVALSPDYFRSVAKVMADAAEALHHAHEAGFLHRDVKPSNIMVDKTGQCWIIDFGLAGYLAEHDRGGRKEGPSRAEPLTDSGVLGTPQYMAPEQFHGKALVPADVWGLGATLYELLTLRRCYDGPSLLDIRAKVETAVPTAPGELVANVPTDLAAICLKALRKEPGQRYATARELGEDLRRWLRHEPTRARPAWVLRRTGLWARRNPGWAVAMALFLVITLGLAGAEFQAARAAKREALRQELQRLRLTAHQAGWTDKGWQMIGQMADYGGAEDLRNQAAAVLAGLDAKLRRHFDVRCGSLAFSPDGKRLWMGAWEGEKGVEVWDLTTDQREKIAELGGYGELAFRPDGAPFQILVGPSDHSSLSLWDMSARKVLRALTIPSAKKDALSASALSLDAAWIAATARWLDGMEWKGIVVVWEAEAGKIVWRTEALLDGVEFAPDAGLLAGWDDKGKVTVWDVPQARIVATLPDEPTPVQCVAFSRDPLRRIGEEKPGWVLAVGHLGGKITVWDLTKQQPRAFCMGSLWEVNALAFSADGMTLASANRARVRLWDAATGQLLLALPVGGTPNAVAFSPDGKHLACSLAPIAGSKAEVTVWDLENDRGIQFLRGLTGQVAQVRLSPDRRFVAALSQTWKVGVWDVQAGRLLYVKEVPAGLFADNAALAFDGDSRRFAFAAGTSARIWEVGTGKELHEWVLPRGKVDQMAFDRPGEKLLLFRMESHDGARVCLWRNLLGPKPLEPFAESKDFSFEVYAGSIAPHGSYVIALGVDNGKRRLLQAFDGSTGKALWPRAREFPGEGGGFIAMDPAGATVSVHVTSEANSDILEMPSGRALQTLPMQATAVGPGADLWGDFDQENFNGFALHRGNSKSPLITLGIDTQSHGFPVFSGDGNQIVWGNEDGTVTVCDLLAVKRRLAEFKLDW